MHVNLNNMLSSVGNACWISTASVVHQMVSPRQALHSREGLRNLIVLSPSAIRPRTSNMPHFREKNLPAICPTAAKTQLYSRTTP